MKVPRCSATSTRRPASSASEVGSHGFTTGVGYRCVCSTEPWRTTSHCPWAAAACAAVATAGVGVQLANAEGVDVGHITSAVATPPAAATPTSQRPGRRASHHPTRHPDTWGPMRSHT